MRKRFLAFRERFAVRGAAILPLLVDITTEDAEALRRFIAEFRIGRVVLITGKEDIFECTAGVGRILLCAGQFVVSMITPTG